MKNNTVFTTCVMTICAYIYIVEAACWFAGVSDTNFLFNCFNCHWMNYDIWHRALSQVIHTEQLAQFNTRDGRAADLLTNSTQNIFNTFIMTYIFYRSRSEKIRIHNLGINSSIRNVQTAGATDQQLLAYKYHSCHCFSWDMYILCTNATNHQDLIKS